MSAPGRSLERRLALAAAGLGVLALFAAAALALAAGQVARPAYLGLVVGAALLIVSLVLDPRWALDLVRSRQARFGTLSVLVTAGFLGVLALLNVIAVRGGAELDLTRAGLYTLSPQSALVARRLSSDLTVTGFFRPDQKQDRLAAEALLHLYGQQSSHVKVRFQDPDQNAAEARSLGVTDPGSLVLQYQERPPVVLNLASQSESDLTGAIIRLESNRTATVCWASGDGERDYLSQDATNGYSTAAARLRTSDYQLRELQMVGLTEVPAGCDVVAVVGPTRPLAPAAQEALARFLAGGGKLLLALGPWESAATTASLNQVVAAYGVAYAGGLVIDNDPNSRLQSDPLVPATTSFGDSPITKDLGGRTVIFPHPTAITGSGGGGVTAADLAGTTPNSYEIVAQQVPRPQRAGDPSGPFVLMKTLELPAAGGGGSRVVMVGTAEFGDNQTLSSGASNADLVQNSFDWLSRQEGVIAVSAKPAADQPIPVTQEQLVVNAFLTLLLVPGLILAAGVLVLLRRRAAPA